MGRGRIEAWSGASLIAPIALRGLADARRGGAGLALRDMPLVALPEGMPARRLADALVAARVLLLHGEGKGAMVRLAHEAVLRGWQRARDIVGKEQDFYRIRQEVSAAEQRWRGPRRSDLLLAPGLPFAEAQTLAATYGEELEPEIVSFIEASSRRERRRQRRAYALAGAFALVALAAIGAGAVAWEQRQVASAALVSAEAQLRVSLTTQSRFLADLAGQQRAAGDAGTALLLALEALPDSTYGVKRPYVPDAEFQFDRAWGSLRERALYIGRTELYRGAIGPDGRRVVTAEGTAAQQWDVMTGKPVGEPLMGHLSGVLSAVFSPDGRQIVTASFDKTARLWDAGSGKRVGAPLVGHEGTVWSAMFSPDGNRVVTASVDGTVRLWDVETGKQIGEPFRVNEQTVWSVAFSPDGKRIVTGSSDGTARVWDIESRKEIAELKGRLGNVFGASFSPDGTRIVTASEVHTRIWDASTGKPLIDLDGHEGWVRTAVFSSDGARILTASDDGTARLWNAETGAPIGEPFRAHIGGLSSAIFSPNGYIIITTSPDRTARVWDLFAAGLIDSSQTRVAQARSKIPRCLTRAQRTQFFLSAEPPAWCIEMGKWPYHTEEWKTWLAQKKAGQNPPLPDATAP